jgi:hypothetical protein
LCLEDWSDEIKEAGNHKKNWYAKMQGKGLGVKLAVDDAGTVGGMIHYVPIENSIVEGRELYFINCVWVHGYKKGRGDLVCPASLKLRRMAQGRSLVGRDKETSKKALPRLMKK